TFDNTNGAITTQALIDAIDADGTFTVAVDATVETSNTAGNGTVDGTSLVSGTEVGNTGNTGGEAGTLFVYVESGKSTAQDVITALGSAGNERANELF